MTGAAIVHVLLRFFEEVNQGARPMLSKPVDPHEPLYPRDDSRYGGNAVLYDHAAVLARDENLVEKGGYAESAHWP
jgi:hypothetical protein